MKHTKVEWVLSYPAINKPEVFNIKDEDGFILAQVFGANGTPLEMEEAEANAKLIAAAPDLLEVCISVYKCSGEKNYLTKSVLDDLLKAIKKATE